jgi:UDPglucose--hexose-1-phosphate uridylyltransferase
MIFEHPHCRYNPLTGDWVLVSPHRNSRPWQGQIEKVAQPNLPDYDPDCYLCPNNSRVGGTVNPNYHSTFTFTNDFSALYPQVPEKAFDENDLLLARSEKGLCRVICFSPDHSLTLARMPPENIIQVINCWTKEFKEIEQLDFIRSIQIFENRGAMMGASNPHPHGQIWASENIPNELGKELKSFENYRREKNNCLLCDYVRLEIDKQQRLVYENNYFAALVPFWAVYPFETIILPKNHRSASDELANDEISAFADILRITTIKYDNLFETSFPYSFGLHQRPVNSGDNSNFHFHAHFFPPLLRSATIRKFLVGFELLGSPQRDLTPETAAESLRIQSEIHYLDKQNP